MKEITANLPEKVVDIIEKLVKEGKYISKSDFVRRAVLYYLEMLKEKGKLNDNLNTDRLQTDEPDKTYFRSTLRAVRNTSVMTVYHVKTPQRERILFLFKRKFTEAVRYLRTLYIYVCPEHDVVDISFNLGKTRCPLCRSNTEVRALYFVTPEYIVDMLEEIFEQVRDIRNCFDHSENLEECMNKLYDLESDLEKKIAYYRHKT